jgi:hypothetical protein
MGDMLSGLAIVESECLIFCSGYELISSVIERETRDVPLLDRDTASRWWCRSRLDGRFEYFCGF